MKKKILSVMLAFCVLVGTIVSVPGVMQVQAEESETIEVVGIRLSYGDYSYKILDDGTVAVTDYIEGDAAEIIIRQRLMESKLGV